MSGIRFFYALAREWTLKEDIQEPPAKRVRLKLKQENILSSIIVSVQATKIQRERMFSMANSLAHTK